VQEVSFEPSGGVCYGKNKRPFWLFPTTEKAKTAQEKEIEKQSRFMSWGALHKHLLRVREGKGWFNVPESFKRKLYTRMLGAKNRQDSPGPLDRGVVTIPMGEL